MKFLLILYLLLGSVYSQLLEAPTFSSWHSLREANSINFYSLVHGYSMHSNSHKNSTNRKNRNGQGTQARSNEEDEVNFSKRHLGSSLMVLALVLTVGYLNYYFKKFHPEFNYSNAYSAKQYLLLQVFRI